MKKGRAAFLVDQPRRGAAGSTVSMAVNTLDTWGADSKLYKHGIRTLESGASLRAAMKEVSSRREKKRKISFSAK